MRVTRDSWSTPRVFKQWPETHGRAGRHRGPTDTSVIRRGELVKTVGPRAQARVARDSLSTPGPSDPGPRRMGQLVDPAGPRTHPRVARESWSKPRSLGHKCESPGTAGQPRALSDMGRKCTGHLVEHMRPRVQSRVSWVSWSTRWDHGHGPESPGLPGQPRRKSGTGPSPPRQMV